MPKIKYTRQRQRGKNIAPEQIRNHCVSVRLNDDELNLLDSKRGKFARGEWLRVAFLDKLPPDLRDIDLELYVSLNKTLGAIGAIVKTDRTLTTAQENNLNQLREDVLNLQTSIMNGGKK